MHQQSRPVERAVEVCATCGQPLIQRGPNGECLRCLLRLGLDADAGAHPEASRSRQRSTPGPLRYAHFEIETGEDGFPIELGAGAMAVTYRARDTVLNSVVALKVIDRAIAENSAARARFLREARAAAQLHHPNVARVTHYGEQDGECFYVMELVQGETLEARVRRDGPLPLALALEMMEQAARAVAAAEARGIVHRDIKPSNLMIEADASGAMLVKVIDYGVAKVIAVDAQPGVDQTHSGFIGTPAFASPEQFAAAGEATVDTRSDIYSLGVTFWYLLTGRTPFAGRTLEEIRARQSGPLPFADLKRAGVPGQVIALLRSMLTEDKADRPQSARELLAAMRRCHARFAPRTRSRRRRLGLFSVAAALALTAIAIAAWSNLRARSYSEMDRAIAVLPFTNLTPGVDDQFLAIGIQDEILTKLASLPNLKVISRTSTETYRDKPQDLKTIGEQLGVGRVLEGSIQRVADRVRVNVKLLDPRTSVQLWANTYERTVDDTFAVQSDVATAVAERLDGKLTNSFSTDRPTRSIAAYNAYLRGIGIENSETTDSSFQKAAEAYAQAVQFDPDFALAWARLSLARSFLFSNGVDRNANSATTVKEATDRALALAPDLGDAWLAHATYQYRVLRDDAAAANLS